MPAPPIVISSPMEAYLGKSTHYVWEALDAVSIPQRNGIKDSYVRSVRGYGIVVCGGG